VLPCNERERRDLAATLGSRPVWLAGDLPMAELPEVIAAQRAASRSAHRLLVIVAPRDGADGPAMARRMAEAGLRVTARADGAEPEEAAQAYLAEGTGEMGLWLRLAPLSYVGGTLAGPGGRNPFEAAALGSAILHGPRTAPWETHWQRLAAAGAARLVRTGAELGGAVESLLAPDRVAAMAHGAWDVATQGADAVARAADVIREALDARDAPRRAGR
jgi:3-deoxy-D-manno-octulosonic-acid transferase